MTRPRLLSLAASLLLPLAAADLHAQADERALTVPPVTERLPGDTLAVDDRTFIDFALARSRVLDQALALAAQRADDPTLRQLAASMQPAHRSLTEGLLTLGGSDVRPATVEPIPDDGLAQLRASRGPAFDRQFLSLVVPLQQAIVERYQQALNAPALSAPVQKLARQALPIAQFHLELLQDQQMAANEQD